MYALVLLLIVSLNMCICRDFYVGMFKPNDLLVAQDVLYKERVYYRKVMAKYGRIFKCPITYFRVVDRLGAGGGPKVEIIRGGLRSKYLVLRLTSPYNYPISVNIYVGCENKMPTRSISHTKPSTKSSSASTSATKISQSGSSAAVTTTDSSKINNATAGNGTAKAAYKK